MSMMNHYKSGKRDFKSINWCIQLEFVSTILCFHSFDSLNIAITNKMESISGYDENVP